MDFIFSALRFVGVLLLVIMVFNLMIVVHEWGHFLAAKWRGLKIEAFQIWFGKPLWKKTINGVQYGLGSIPAGGFVKLPQMAPMGAIEGASSSDEPLPPISALDKIIVAFAGPLFSFGLACAFAVVVYFTGYPDQSVHNTVIGYIKKDMPAGQSDLRPGDRILKVDGTPVKTWIGILDSVTERIAFSTGDTIVFTVERPGVDKPLDIPSHYKIEEGHWNKRQGIRQVGVAPREEVAVYQVYPQGPAALAGLKVGDVITTLNGQPLYSPGALADAMKEDPTKAVRLGVRHQGSKSMEEVTLSPVKPVKPADAPLSLGIEYGGQPLPGDFATEPLHTSPSVLIKNALTVVYRTVTALFAKGSSISPQQLSGPVRIGSMYYHLFLLRDGWQVVLWFSVIFNVNLAVLNLLPFPVLDGGHIVMGILEMIRRRPVMNLKVLEFIQTACVLLLFGFMIYVTWFDSFDTFGSSPKEPQKPAPEFAAPAKQKLKLERIMSDRHAPGTLRYCPDLYHYQRRETREVMVGKVGVGGGNPIRVQSMLTSDTRDAEACVKEALGLVAVGCEIVRVTAQTRPIAENLEHIKAGLLAAGCDVPLVADIHFKPDAAMEAARWVEKVRVNPGNYVDKKKFAVREYTDAEYAEEVASIKEAFVPLVKLCQEKGRAMRIGTNHGSLSDRIMNRYGDTPLGMVESALEFARIARDHHYHSFVFSMKASNPKVMIEAYRLLVAKLNELGGDWNYPIHLGVTEAGDGEDGRIKSAIGIGSLLTDGIGDTIRVSLTEDAVYEIPVAQALVECGVRSAECGVAGESPKASWDPFSYERRKADKLMVNGVPLGGEETTRVFTTRRKWDAVAHKLDKLGDFKPEIVIEDSGVIAVDPRDNAAIAEVNTHSELRLVTVSDGLDLAPTHAFRLLAAKLDARHPILLKDTLHPTEAFSQADDESHDFLSILLTGSMNIGSLLCDGIGDAVLVQGEEAPGQSLRLSYNILQAAGTRIFKTDYVACPSCGRTLFNLQTTTQRIRAATGHLKGVRIAVMGCIVNGPGEMADADFGYVGGAPSKINLYVGKTAVKFNIPEDEAVARLIDLIKEHDRWVDAPVLVGSGS